MVRAKVGKRYSKSLNFEVEENLKSKRKLNIADSDLVVVKAFWEGCDLKKNLDYEPKMVNISWSNDILEGLSKGELDLAIFNEALARDFLKKNQDVKISILGNIGYSMNGRHFTLITRNEFPIGGESMLEIRNNLKGRTIVIGKKTDRFKNFLTIFDIDENFIRDNGIRIVDQSEPPLAFLEAIPNAIIVGGQNVRFQAKLEGKYHETKIYDILPREIKTKLKKSASNVLICGSGITDIESQFWYQQLMESFNANKYNKIKLNRLINSLAQSCDFGDNNSLEKRKKITREVLFETYQLGDPEW